MSARNSKMYIESKYSTINPFTTKVPSIDAIVHDPISKADSKQTEKFLIDTGAELTILAGAKFKNLFASSPIIGHKKVQYGGSPSSTKGLPIYNICLKIKGHALPTKAILDKNINFSLLGHDFFNKNIDILVFDTSEKISKLIRKYRK